MVFTIGSQQAASISNVAGDLTVHGDVRATATVTVTPDAEVARLRDAVRSRALPPCVRAEADEHLRDVAAELARPAPAKARIARRLSRLADVLAGAGALAAAGSAVVAPLRALASWLGPLGLSVLRHLPQ